MPELPEDAVTTAGDTRRRVAFWAILVLIVLVIGGMAWCLWPQPPIQAVKLSAGEVAAIEAKLDALENPGPTYEKGGKEIRITERELNGLLHHNTGLGDKLRLELAHHAVHARIETDLDPDLPMIGGRHLKARARFLLDTPGGQPALILDDVTVWGISLPNDWLGQLKGRDLLGEALGSGGSGFPGIQSIEVRRGELRIHLKE